MQPLVIAHTSFTPFQVPFKKPFTFAGTTVTERTGFYVNITSSDGFTGQGEAAPLPGISPETLRKTEHDLKEFLPGLNAVAIPGEKRGLIEWIRKNEALNALCPSARFAIESALFTASAASNQQSLAEFLEADDHDVYTAGLLQGTHAQVVDDAKAMAAQGIEIFKIKVGDRNIPLDVKKVNDVRAIAGEDCLLRLDGNRVWSLKEALLFMELAGLKQIEYIEEPLSDISQLSEFYHKTHVPVALDETLSVLRCGIQAPGRCGPTLAQHEAVQAYILKPMVLGGIVTALDWMEEAKSTGRKAIVSSSFESSVGIRVLASLSLISGQVAGLGTTRWMTGEDVVDEQGIIGKDRLK